MENTDLKTTPHKQPEQKHPKRSYPKWLKAASGIVLMVLPIVAVAYVGVNREKISQAASYLTMSAGAVTQTSIVINWTDHSKPVDSFMVTKSPPTPNEYKLVGPSIRTYTWTGLACGTQYIFGVMANETDGGNALAANGPLYVTTSACPAPTPAPSPPPPPSSPTPTPATKPIAKTPLQGSTNVVIAPATPAADTTPPSVPVEFRAVAEEASFVINIFWLAGGEGGDIDHYVLERSEDKVNWPVLNDSITGLSYSDKDTSFNTKYYYRIKAVDASGNNSEYVMAEATSSGFASNITKANGGTINLGEVVTVSFPAEAVPEDLYCIIQDNLELVSAVNNYELVAGPYEIICKNFASIATTKFNKPLNVEIVVTGKQQKQYKDLRHYALRYDAWSEAHKGSGSYSLENSNTFALYGKSKATPVWGKILMVLIALIAFVAGIIYILYLRYRRQQQSAVDDYYSKMNGL